jgi:hypothetical protein
MEQTAHAVGAQLPRWRGWRLAVLACCVLALVGFALSFWRGVCVEYVTPRILCWQAELSRGWVTFGRHDPRKSYRTGLPEYGLYARWIPYPSAWTYRFRWNYKQSVYPDGPWWNFYYQLPLWPVAAGIAATGGWTVLLMRRRQGMCSARGYDLRGNVTGVCPECGQKRATGA